LSEEEVQAYAARRAAEGERDPSATFVEIPPVLAERSAGENPAAGGRPLAKPGASAPQSAPRPAPRVSRETPRLMPTDEAEPLASESATWRPSAARKTSARGEEELANLPRPSEVESGPVLRR
jgi:hypothetical protein